MVAHEAGPVSQTGRGGSIEGNSRIVSPPDLAAQINHEHDLAVQCAEGALDHAYRAGELLIQAKADVGHGGWLNWLSANCKVGVRQAQRYMRLVEAQSKTTRVSHLSQRAALAELAAPAPSPKRPTKTSTSAPADHHNDCDGDAREALRACWAGAPEDVRQSFLQMEGPAKMLRAVAASTMLMLEDRPHRWGDPTKHYRWSTAPESVKAFVAAVQKEHKQSGGNTRLSMLFYVLDLLDLKDEFARWCEHTRCMREASQ